MSEANRSIRAILISVTISFVLLLPASGRATAQVGDKEPNNSPGQAIAIPLPATLPGEIQTDEDIDFYKFTATAGQEIIVWLRAENGLGPTLAFYDSNGRLLAYNDLETNLGNGGEAEDPILYLKIPASGNYFVSISSSATFQNAQGGGTGGYTLSVFQRWFWAVMSDRHEPNDTLRTATPITLPFDSVVSDLTYLGDVDWFEFSALAGENISIDIEAIESAAHSPWLMTVNARVGIFDDSKHLLQEVPPGRDPDSGFAEDPATIFKAPRDGKYYVGVTTGRDSQYRSILNEPSFLADPYVSSADHLIGSYLLRVRVIQDLFFPQIANGSFGSIYFKTSVILVNPGDTEVTGSISFCNDDGTPMEISNLPSQDVPGHCWFHIPPKGDFVFVTDGNGPGTSGYARVQVPGSIGGSAIFSEYTGAGELITEAAVAMSPRMEFFTFPVDVTGDFNTGVAIANPEDKSAINVYLNLLDLSGTSVAHRSLLLNPGSQIAIYVSGIGQLFPGLQNFRGSLQVLADLPVPAVALRSSSRTLTTLPAVSLNQEYQPVTLHFPQMVVGPSGGSYRSTIILTNPSYYEVAGSIRFTKSDGSPMGIRFDAASGPGSYEFKISAQGALFLESIPSEVLMTGYAIVTADHGVGGVAIFSQFDDSGKLLTEAAVPPAPLAEEFLIFAQSDASYNTGVALANVGPATAELSYQLHEDPAVQGSLQGDPSDLSPGCHRSVMLSGNLQLFPEFSGTGTLEVRSTTPIPAVALRITPTTMTALPVVPIRK